MTLPWVWFLRYFLEIDQACFVMDYHSEIAILDLYKMVYDIVSWTGGTLTTLRKQIVYDLLFNVFRIRHRAGVNLIFVAGLGVKSIVMMHPSSFIIGLVVGHRISGSLDKKWFVLEICDKNEIEKFWDCEPFFWKFELW